MLWKCCLFWFSNAQTLSCPGVFALASAPAWDILLCDFYMSDSVSFFKSPSRVNPLKRSSLSAWSFWVMWHCHAIRNHCYFHFTDDKTEVWKSGRASLGPHLLVALQLNLKASDFSIVICITFGCLSGVPSPPHLLPFLLLLLVISIKFINIPSPSMGRTQTTF